MSRISALHRRWAVLGAIVLMGLLFRVWGLTWGLHDATVSRRPQPDEWVIYWVFHWFNQTGTLNPCPSSGSCFFDWGAVFPYLAYGLHLVISPLLAVLPPHAFGTRADSTFVEDVLAGRIFSVLASTLTILLTYRLAAVCYGAAAGIGAALLVALSGLLIQLAHFATPDSTTVLLVTATLLAATHALKNGWSRSFAGAGVLLGLAAGSEYHMALLSVPIVVAWLLSPHRQAMGLLTAGVGAGIAFIASNPYVLVDLPQFGAAMEHTLRIRTVDSQAEYGDRWAQYGPGWLYVVRYPLGYGIGFAFTIWVGAGAAWAAIQHHREDIFLYSWIVPYFLLVSISSAKFMRYSAPLLPPLAVLGGRAAADAVRLLAGWRVWRGLTVGGLTAALLYTTTYDAAYAGLFSSPEPRAVAVNWLQAHAPRRSRVGFEELPDGLVNLPYFASGAGFRPCFLQFDAARLNGPMKYVAIDTYTEEEHPRITTATTDAFHSALRRSTSYRLVEQVHYVPTFFGMTFPIDGSPHDWRYASHQILIYKQTAPRGGSAHCYNTVTAAVAALYPARTRRA